MMFSGGVEWIINGRSKAKFHKVKDTDFHVSSNYVQLESIGEGSFGVVCSALNTSTNEQVAIKKISLKNSPGRASRILREVEILRHLRKHKAIVELKDIMIPSLPFINNEKKNRYFNDIYLVFELMEGTLKGKINSDKEFTDKDYQHILAQLLLGLRHIHLSNIMHRDMKPGNVLVDESLNLKICDFGLSRARRTSRKQEPDEEGNAKEEEEIITKGVGTIGYTAPEIILGSEVYDHAVDIWSVGCIFAYLVNKKPLFLAGNTSKNDRLKNIMAILRTTSLIMGGDTKEKHDLIIDNQGEDGLNSSKYSAEENSVLQPAPVVVPFSAKFPNLNPAAIELLERMLVLEPEKRITAEEALKHRYIATKVEEMKNEFGYDDPIEELIKKEDEKSIDKLRKLLWDQMKSINGDRIPNCDDDDDLS